MKSRTKSQHKQQASRSKPPARSPAAPAEPRGKLAAAALVLLVLVVVAYLPVVRAGFIWDDESYVENNEALRSTNGLRRIWLDTSTEKQYYPLVHSTFWLEYHLWGLHPVGYHLVNVALHATSVILLWRLLARFTCRGHGWRPRCSPSIRYMVESVAWVTERKNVLSLTLALLSLHAYLRFAPADEEQFGDRGRARSGGAWRWYALSLVLFVAALLSKTVVATLPAVILVIYWWKRGKIRLADVVPLVPFFAAGIGLGLITLWIEEHTSGRAATNSIFRSSMLVDRGPGGVVLLLASSSGRIRWLSSIRALTIDDHALAILVPDRGRGGHRGLMVAGARIGRGPLAAVLIFGGVLVPALGFFNVYPFRYSLVADHFQYHASLALFALAAQARC